MKFVRARVIISGDVQNIGFRFNTRIKARNLGLTGWVRNLPNRSVEAVFEGPEDKVKEIIEWCKKGPSFARVDNIKIELSEYKGEFEGFENR